ncbi:hypothetical protein QOZ88_04190 [Blastococcus sp. BMG 814]|uniref:GPR1/FUN34/yaaH family protein n=1 Tax=Blastococcus carthaginiensis TaxID=3050034 RepID=A0ABT9I8C7_9ACTN|nr:hypothetical protein [Blastococcus carthaginiensis]MDP5181826.1 hypothetical protein [Blastococcus carthaginiensis]
MTDDPDRSRQGRDAVDAAVRVTLRPTATPLPISFLGLALASTVFAVVELGWLAPDQGRVAALVAVAATVPLQLLAAVFGFLARDPVAGTGCALMAVTWAVTGLTTLTSPPGATVPGLGVLLLAAGAGTLVPATAGSATPLPAAVLALVGVRFAVTGVYQLTASPAWGATAGWVGLGVAGVAAYAALALELEGVHHRAVLPVGRRGTARAAAQGDEVFDAGELAREPGVRPRL